MKVIAKISEDAVLCEVSRNEIALLAGYYSPYDQGITIKHWMEIGTELQLKKMAGTSRFIRTASKEKLVSLQKELQVLLNSVDGAINTVDSLNLFANLSEEEPF